MKNLNRRNFVALSGAAGVAMAVPGCVPENPEGVYPQRDITFIVPNAAGGNFDSFARAVASAMPKYLPNPVNIIPLNVPAGGGGKGLADLYRSPADGYTIGAVNVPGAFTLQERMGRSAFDLEEMVWLTTLAGGETYAVVVAPDSPIRNLDDLRALSQQRPIKFASTGPEGSSYAAIKIATEIIGIDTQIITGYSGSNDYIVATIRGDGDCAVATLSILRSYVEANTVRLLVSFEEKSSVPGVPSATDVGLQELSQISVERMVAAPPGLPDDIKKTLNAAIAQAVQDPEVLSWAQEAGFEWVPQPEGNGDAVMRTQSAFFEKWKSVILS